MVYGHKKKIYNRGSTRWSPCTSSAFTFIFIFILEYVKNKCEGEFMSIHPSCRQLSLLHTYINILKNKYENKDLSLFSSQF